MTTLNPSVKVTLDKERVLLFDINAHIAFEEAMNGQQMLTVIKQIAINALSARDRGEPEPMPPMKILIALLYAGLYAGSLDEHGNQTADTRMLNLGKVAQMVGTLSNMFDLYQAIGAAVGASLPEVKQEDIPRKAPARAAKRTR